MSNFITRIGTQLYLGSQPFKFAGINSYDLSYRNGDSSISDVSAFAVMDILNAAKDMGANVIRVKDFGISQGHTGTFEPTQGVFDETATGPTQVWDYALWQASLMGIYLIPMMTDENTDLTGSGTVGVFCNWAGVAMTYDNFYTNATVIQYYEQYLSRFLNHVNIYTGIAYKNDPAIFAIETGNELYGQGGSVNCANWVNTISTYFKTIDTNHLFMDGTWQAFPLNAALPNVDLLNDHFYPMDIVRLQNDINVCIAANKPLIIGEYNWADDSSSGTLTSFLAQVEANTNIICGDAPWNLDWHSLNYGYHNQIGNQGTLDIWYPGGAGDHGDTSPSDKAARQQQMRTHGYAMRGIPVPPHALLMSTPLITSINASGAHNILQWRGVAGAYRYTLESAIQSPPTPWHTVTTNANDFSTPYTDTTQPSGNVLYRIKAWNLDDIASGYSPVTSSGSMGTYLGTDTFTHRFVPPLFTTWDYSSDGQKWTTLTGSPVLSLTSTSGTIATNSGSQNIIMQLGSRTGADMEGYVVWTPGVIGDTVCIYLRLLNSSHYYRLSNLGTSLTIGKNTGSGFTSLVTASVPAPIPGNFYWFHFKVVGTALTGKLWMHGTPEPTNATISITDSSIVSGGYGLGAIPTTTTPVQFTQYTSCVPQTPYQGGFVTVRCH